jgi:hypothetical protein
VSYVTTTAPTSFKTNSYKPNPCNTGGVLRFELNREKACALLDAAPQKSEKQFDWETKISMKWGLSDLGSTLPVLERRMPKAKLFHKSEKATSTFEINFRDDPERAPYMVSVTRQETADKSLRKVAIPLTHAEASALETGMRTAIARILGW